MCFENQPRWHQLQIGKHVKLTTGRNLPAIFIHDLLFIVRFHFSQSQTDPLQNISYFGFGFAVKKHGMSLK